MMMTPCMQGAERPNILWFVVDDMSAHFSSYGETTINTPNVDRLVKEGMKFTRAQVTAPVCSTCRSAMITGMYQTTIGAHHHRSGRGELKIHLPEGVEPVPVLFQKGGYYTCIGSGLPDLDARGLPFGLPKGKKAAKRAKLAGNPPESRLGKTDYNFEWDPAMYDSHDWAGRGKDQPFFMQVQLPGGKLRGGDSRNARALAERAKAEFGEATDPQKVTLPPYYPRDPVLLEDWAAYLDAVKLTDKHVGKVLARLEAEWLLENTLIIFMTDHGISHARGKQFLYDEGSRIPFVVRGPGIVPGTVREDMIQQIDMAPLSLAAAGLPVPEVMQGRDVLAKDYKAREAVYAARDRCDETVERIRSVRTDKFLYIRNFYPERPHLQPNAYKDGKDIVRVLRAAHEAGTLPSVSEELLFSPKRQAEELYEYVNDRWQVTNLAANPDYREVLESHRAKLDQWMTETKDAGPESEAMYDSDMVDYRKKGGAEIERNIALMKQWAKEGK
ncbi:arylsulfatase A-like enzyme [Prosthecobacter fusiformis]|uniref:Arylsulfatase A-like enzyme n=2 Tax=Prosthecobacter fusiformis TaxID=48464 RepID=A0A4R7SP51_9BACT|nr:arylsulfatase A-like enzyme [Prosthecobacter fusiformis]